MAAITVLPNGTYAIGTRNLGPASVPQNLTLAKLALDGASMTNPALHVELTLDFSLDGGTTWASTTPSRATDPYPLGITLDGGALDKSGNPRAEYFVNAPLPDPTNPNRRIRGVVTIAGTPLTTTGTLTLI